MLRFLDAGESHGRGMVTIVEGMPHGVTLSARDIEAELARRRLGYGRGGRMSLEGDRVEIISGVRSSRTLGSPLAMLVSNSESEKWAEVMQVEGKSEAPPLTAPRPGHADLAGALKYGTRDLRDVLERASARETVGRVCAGATAKRLLAELKIQVWSHVVVIGGIRAGAVHEIPGLEAIREADADPLRCLDPEASRRMREEIDAAKSLGDTLGGIFEVIAFGLPAGLGSHVHWDRRLDARLAAAVMSIQAIKGVEFGAGFELAAMRGSQSADVILHEPGRGFYRRTNRSGGVEGGMTNGEPLLIRAAMKPIPTLLSPPETVDLVSKRVTKAAVERADVCAVPAAGVIAEAMVAFIVADALLEKTGGDGMEEVRSRYETLSREQERY